MLQSNLSACHIKLSEWKEAVDAATKSIDALERIDPLPKEKPDKDKDKRGGAVGAGAVVEEVDDETAEKIEALEKSGRTRDEVQKIRVKAFLRRAKARSELGGWAALQGAYEGERVLETTAVLACCHDALTLVVRRLHLPRYGDYSLTT